MLFVSPTKGTMSWSEVVKDLINYVLSDPGYAYKLIIGTDSHVREETHFVTAVIAHRVGKGAVYYYSRKLLPKIVNLQQRIFYEATMSLELASKLTNNLAELGYPDINIEIHLDIGPNGETKELIRDVVGMIVGSGFDAKIKPDSCGASTVADRYTK